MAGISMTGLGLPAGNGSAIANASTVPQPGPTVGGQGGSTTLPSASAADFNTSPTPLDKPHDTYPSLLVSHVAVLQAIGTPATDIQLIASTQPQAGYIDRYLQGEVMQNPEGWDDLVGNPRGTARAGLQKLMPNVQLPGPGSGSSGYLPDGSTVSGINVPGLTTPLLNPTTGAPQVSGGGGMVKGALLTAAAAGVGLIGWKVFRGSKPEVLATGAEQFAGIVDKSVRGSSGARTGAGQLDGLTGLGKRFMASGVDGDDMDLVIRGAALESLGAHGTQSAATAYGVLHGLAPGDGYVQSIVAAAKFGRISEELAHKLSMENGWMDVLKTSARNGGTLGDVAAASIVAGQAVKGGGGAAAPTVPLAGLQQIFQGAANVLS